jgi:hypothetical protein
MSDDMSWTSLPLTYEPPEIDTSVPHSARVYDYVLGGKDNYPVDREAAEQMLRGWPELAISMRENRKFMHRMARFFAEQGIDQFLDIGTGIPTSSNTHEVAQSINPAAGVVYVDNDPVVLAHARALLTSNVAGQTAYLDRDLRAPETILNDPDLRATIDLGKPVGLLLCAVLPFTTDDVTVHDVVRTFVGALAPGSYVAISHATFDPLSDETRTRLEAELGNAKAGHGAVRPRSLAELTAIVDPLGLETVAPGWVSTVHWHPEKDPEPETNDPAEAACYAFLGRRT